MVLPLLAVHLHQEVEELDDEPEAHVFVHPNGVFVDLVADEEAGLQHVYPQIFDPLNGR